MFLLAQMVRRLVDGGCAAPLISGPHGVQSYDPKPCLPLCFAFSILRALCRWGFLCDVVLRFLHIFGHPASVTDKVALGQIQCPELQLLVRDRGRRLLLPDRGATATAKHNSIWSRPAARMTRYPSGVVVSDGFRDWAAATAKHHVGIWP